MCVYASKICMDMELAKRSHMTCKLAYEAEPWKTVLPFYYGRALRKQRIYACTHLQPAGDLKDISETSPEYKQTNYRAQNNSPIDGITIQRHIKTTKMVK